MHGRDEGIVRVAVLKHAVPGNYVENSADGLLMTGAAPTDESATASEFTVENVVPFLVLRL